MPRTKFDRPKYPPINKLRAAILERKHVSGLTWDDLADVAGVSGVTLRRLLREKDPWDWPKDVRTSICRKLEIKTTLLIDGWED